MATRDAGVVEKADSSAGQAAGEAREKAETGSGWYAWLARGGLVAKGVSYGIVAALAIGVAIGTGGETTSRQGALATLAQETWGKIALIVLAAGFAAYALWRFIQALAEREDDGDKKATLKKWGNRAGYVGRGLADGGLRLPLAAGSSRRSSSSTQASNSRRVQRRSRRRRQCLTGRQGGGS